MQVQSSICPWHCWSLNFLDRARDSYVDSVDQNWGTRKNALVSCQDQAFLMDFCSSPNVLVRELMKDVWFTHAAKRNTRLCLFAQTPVYNEGKQCCLVFCFPTNTTPNVGLATNRGKVNSQYPCLLLQGR